MKGNKIEIKEEGDEYINIEEEVGKFNIEQVQ